MERGFTLIELLIVVAIISVLAAIAIPQFYSYRARAHNTTALSDLRQAITAQEAFLVDNNSYQVCSDAGCNEPALPGFTLSPGVSIQMQPVGQEFTAMALHESGDLRYDYASATGQFTNASP